MFGTLFTDSVGGATFLISITGISWAITQWAPFSLLGEAILTTPDPDAFGTEQIQLSDARTPSQINIMEEREGLLSTGGGKQFKIADEDSGSESDDEDGVHRHPAMSVGGSGTGGIFSNPAARASHTRLGEHEQDWEPIEAVEAMPVGSGRVDREIGDAEANDPPANGRGLSARAGVILGIHNVSIVIPQFLVTGISSIMFAILEPVQPHPAASPSPPKAGSPASTTTRRSASVGGHQGNSVVYIFGLGGVAALVAFVLCWRLAREMRHR